MCCNERGLHPAENRGVLSTMQLALESANQTAAHHHSSPQLATCIGHGMLTAHLVSWHVAWGTTLGHPAAPARHKSCSTRPWCRHHHKAALSQHEQVYDTQQATAWQATTPMIAAPSSHTTQGDINACARRGLLRDKVPQPLACSHEDIHCALALLGSSQCSLLDGVQLHVWDEHILQLGMTCTLR